MPPHEGDGERLDMATRQRIASAGGRAGHHYGTARQWTRDEAVAASQKAAQSRRRKAEERRAGAR